MAKLEIKHNPRVTQIFEDLEKYKEFCIDYGYVFNEAELYDSKSFGYRQHIKQLQGKQPKNCWDQDMKV